MLDPTILGITKANGSDLVGGDAQQNAKIARIVLGADNWDAALQPARDIVRLNAAGGIVAYQMAKDAKLAELDIHERFAAALSEVDTALASGAPAQKLSSWITATQA